MKKIIGVVFVIFFALSLVGCAKTSAEDNSLEALKS